jgi:hypothetical protein
MTPSSREWWPSPSRIVFDAQSAIVGGSVVNFIMYKSAGTTDLPFMSPSRILSHLVLAELPEEAVEEALEELSDIWSDCLAAWGDRPTLLPSPRFEAQVSERRESAPILIEGE